ncbi:MAG: DUF6261 family protein [Tannerellaceae bacterium]|nr:DUF6261 family protein [Tannerellaceae bacterium]
MLAINYNPSFPRRLRNAEHFSLYSAISGHFRTAPLKPASLTGPVNAFLQAFDKEDELYKRSAKQEETRHIKVTHEKRRTSYVALRRCVELGVYSEDAQVKEAADTLMEVFENYSNAYYAPMNEVSALVTNLIQDLEKEKHAPLVALITGAEDGIERLQRDNDAFIELYVERTVSEGDQKSEGTLSSARRQSDSKLTDVIFDINACFRANELLPVKDPEVSASLGDAIRFINSFIQKYEAIYARRNPKYRPAGKDDTQPETPDGETPGDDGIPQLAISAQAVVGTGSISGIGVHMSLQAVNPTAFANILYPDAKDGVMKILNPETDTFVDLPIADFLFDSDGTTPIGLLVDPPAANVFFEKPYYGFGDIQTTEVLKDGEILAYLTGVQYPATMID